MNIRLGRCCLQELLLPSLTECYLADVVLGLFSVS
jgi:hypothetical protein